ncbi:MAG: lipid-A-disaccharide synthase N-terminal domain-containing protein [Bacteroidetes bacterium]|nr:lipid-A-disaccharide synthase N-terminal domain-containing protein [Bacteroidota bacterium]
MEFSWLLALGFFAQALFGARSVVQWYLSEKQGKVVSPTLFWVFSLCGSSLFLIYGLLRQDGVILIGQSISFYIYVRNLQLKDVWRILPLPIRGLVLCIPPSIAFLQIRSSANFQLFDSLHPLILLGVAGQLLLNCRYLYQWYYSEQAHESLLPLGFWVISAVASLLVVAYSLYAADVVLLVAQSLGLVVYGRNIIIYLRRGLAHEVRK